MGSAPTDPIMKYVSIDISFFANDDFDYEAYANSLRKEVEKDFKDVEVRQAACEWDDEVIEDD